MYKPVELVNSKVTQWLCGWDEPIQEAKSQLEALEMRKKGLLELIARFEEFKKLGEPFPLDKTKAGTEQESIPA